MTGFFQDTGLGVGGCGLFQYQRLERRDDGAAAAAAAAPRPRWLPAELNGKKAASPCLFHAKKLRWSSIASVLAPRKKVAELSAKVRHAGEADVCPTVIFMSPWGLPVLSRPLLAGHRSRYRRGRGDAF